MERTRELSSLGESDTKEDARGQARILAVMLNEGDLEVNERGSNSMKKLGEEERAAAAPQARRTPTGEDVTEEALDTVVGGAVSLESEHQAIVRDVLAAGDSWETVNPAG